MHAEHFVCTLSLNYPDSNYKLIMGGVMPPPHPHPVSLQEVHRNSLNLERCDLLGHDAALLGRRLEYRAVGTAELAGTALLCWESYSFLPPACSTQPEGVTCWVHCDGKMRMGEWRYNSKHPQPRRDWRWMVTFTLRPLLFWWKCSRLPMNGSLNRLQNQSEGVGLPLPGIEARWVLHLDAILTELLTWRVLISLAVGLHIKSFKVLLQCYIFWHECGTWPILAESLRMYWGGRFCIARVL